MDEIYDTITQMLSDPDTNDRFIQSLVESWNEAEAQIHGFDTIADYLMFLNNEYMVKCYENIIYEKVTIYSFDVIRDAMTDVTFIHKYYVHKLFRHPSQISIDDIKKYILLGDIKVSEVPQYFYDWIYAIIKGDNNE